MEPETGNYHPLRPIPTIQALWPRYRVAGHGGFHVAPALLATMPTYLRNIEGWSRKICEWAKVALAFPERFTSKDLEHAKESRRDHEIINGSRRKRIARGSGTTVQEVNNLLRQYAQMRKMFKTMGSGGGLKAQQRLMSQMQSRQKFGR